MELSDALSPAQLQERIHQTFAVVKNTVEAEINGTGPSPKGNGHEKANGQDREARANGNDKATNAQIKYLTGLATQRDLRLSGLNALCQQQYKVESIYDLTK